MKYLITFALGLIAGTYAAAWILELIFPPRETRYDRRSWFATSPVT